MKLANRTCVFAGATGNIGRGAVRQMAEAGMNVVMVTHNPDTAKSLIEEMSGLPGTVTAMSNSNSDAAVFAAVAEKFGSVDVIINTTGGLDKAQSLESITAEDLDKKLHHQITSVFGFVQAALPYLRKSSAARIILCSTIGALDGFDGENLVDSIARGGVSSMTYGLARMLMADGITVNCIARSGMIDDHPAHRPNDYSVSQIADRLPMGRPGSSEEFGALVTYIASEESAYVTGQVYNFSGGLHIGA